MATQTTTTLVDDIDGSTDDVVTCAFGLGDSHFEIDLNAAHREQLETALSQFVEAARLVKGGAPARQVRKANPERVDRDRTQAIRAWAQENGYEVSARGRISKNIVAAYESAN